MKRLPTNWNELGTTLRELFDFKEAFTSRNVDFHGRKIQNAGIGTEPDDYVVLKQLHDLVGGGISQPPQKSSGKGVYDKITFGIGVGSSVSVGNDLTPPYIWSNSANGSPQIILAAANVPPVGADLRVNIKRNGVGIFSAGFYAIPDGTGAKVVVRSTTVFNSGIQFTRGDVVTIDAIQVGTTTPGQQVTFVIFCRLL